MNAKYSFTPGSLAHCGSIVSFTLLDEIRPTAFSRPAGSRNEIDDAEVGTKNRSGFQLISATPLIICEVNLSSTTPNITLAPEAFSVAICELIVGADVSYIASDAIMVAALSPSARLKPAT